MERRIKERLTGAAILVMLGVIFIPMILDDSIQTETTIEETNIPERPKGVFDSRTRPPDKPESRPGAETETRRESLPQPVPPPSVKPEESATAAAALDRETDKKADQKEEQATAPEPPAERKPQQTMRPEQGADTVGVEGAEETAAEKVSPDEAKPRGLKAWVVQIGSFGKEDNANSLVRKLQDMGYPAFIERLKQDSGVVYRVRIGPELLRSDASALKEKLEREVEMEGIVVEYP